MEGPGSRDRSRPPPGVLLRASSSRSSSNHVRMNSSHSSTGTGTGTGTASSTHNPVPIPSPSTNALAHSLRHTSRSSLSNTGSDNLRRSESSLSRQSTKSSTVASSYLQEKLDQRRKLSDMSSSQELRAVHSSPVRRTRTSDGKRPRSSNGADAFKPRGMGLREEGQVIATLQKQNFDLKLEIYHRRERQATLEARIETLESQEAKLNAMNDKFIAELEKRDKAIEEAVDMIASLEARLDRMVREREMVRQVDAERYWPADAEPSSTPKLSLDHTSHDDARALVRMPSFVSERNVATENLRSVYLENLADGLLNLPEIPEDSNNESRFTKNLPTPNMSVLSESSFLTIYGASPSRDHQRTKQEKREALKRVRTDVPFARDLINHNLPPTPDTISTSTLRHFNKNSNDTLSRKVSHEQVIAEEEPNNLAPSETTTTSRSSSGELPPVADRYSNKRSQPPSTTSSGELPPIADRYSNERSQPPSTTAFNSRREETNGTSYFDNHPSFPTRPRSADETTVSHHHHHHGRNSWESDSSNELNGDDSASLHDYWMQEALMPPGTKIGTTQKAASTRTRTGRMSPDLFSFPTSKKGWATNVMFGSAGDHPYPGTTSAPMSQHLDALGDSLPTPQTGLFGAGLVSPGLIGGVPPPPPPNRRSSLHARTGSSAATASLPMGTPVLPSPEHRKLRKSPIRGSPSSRPMSRTNSSDGRPASSKDVQASQQSSSRDSVPTPTRSVPTPKQQRHYPPASNAVNPPRSRGLNIFRRSGSHEAHPTMAPMSAPPTETTFASAASSKKPQMGMVGIPSWGKRTDLVDEDRDSATPPPILRNPRWLGGLGRVRNKG